MIQKIICDFIKHLQQQNMGGRLGGIAVVSGVGSK
jgi:hypothetical protein